MFSKSYPSFKVLFKQCLLHEALPYYSQLEGLSLSFFFQQQCICLGFLSLIASNLVFYCTAYVSLLHAASSLRKKIVSPLSLIPLRVPSTCPEYCREISQWVLEVIFLVTHTLCICSTINNSTPASLRRSKGLAFWQFAYLVASSSHFIVSLSADSRKAKTRQISKDLFFTLQTHP